MKRLFRFPFRSRDDIRADVDTEFAFHLDMRTDELRATGLSEAEARAQAHREFGNRRGGADDCVDRGIRIERRHRLAHAVATLTQDLQFAARLLWRSPVFTIVSVLTLALGIGANTAIFSVFEQVLLRPLPVAEPARLVNLAAPGPKPGNDNCNEAGPCSVVFSYPMFRDLQRDQTTFTGIAAHRTVLVSVSEGGQAASGFGAVVSGNYFSVLGLSPALGRLIVPSDDGAPDTGNVAVLSHAFWRERFAADPGVLGRTIVVNNHPLTIVGVAPEGFTGTTLGLRPLVYSPLSMANLLQRRIEGMFENRRRYWLYLFARLQPGVSLEQAQTAVNVPYRALLESIEVPLHNDLSPQTLERFRTKTIEVTEGSRGQSDIHGQFTTPVTLLFGVTAIVLLVACANIANLLLARSAARSGEMAVRLSLGASRGRLVALLLTESCLIALLGAIAGLFVSRWTLVALGRLLPQEGLSTHVPLGLDQRAVAFALGLSLVTGVLFGLYPAWHSTRRSLVTNLRDRAGQSNNGRAASRFRTVLVTAQMALATALLICAGLFVRSLSNVARTDLGLHPESVVSFALLPMLNGYPPERSRALFEEIETRMRALPGVTSVSASQLPWLSHSSTGGNIRVQGFPEGPDVDRNIRSASVGPGFVRTLGLTLLAGRDITESDAAGAPRVAIVNEAFVRKFKLGANPIGVRLADWDSPPRDASNGEALDMEIVGLVRDTAYSDIKAPSPAMVIRAYRQSPSVGATMFYIRADATPESVMAAIPGAVASVDPYVPVQLLRPLEQQVRENIYVDRMVGFLSAAFAGLATLLAALGLYGVLSYAIGQRTREFGLRMALGANAAQVRALILRSLVRITVVGAALGVVGGLLAGRYARTVLYQLDGHDPVTIVGAVVLLSAVALVAGLLPAQRAASIEPMEALRSE